MVFAKLAGSRGVAVTLKLEDTAARLEHVSSKDGVLREYGGTVRVWFSDSQNARVIWVSSADRRKGGGKKEASL